MEHPFYRTNLELVRSVVGPNRVDLYLDDIRKLTGLTDQRTIEKHFDIVKEQNGKRIKPKIAVGTFVQNLCGVRVKR